MAKEAIEYQKGQTIDLTLSGDVSVGDIIPLGLAMVCVAVTSGLTGEVIAVETEKVWQVTAATADAVAVGDQLYFDAVNRVVTIIADSVGDGTGVAFAKAGKAVSLKTATVVGTVYVKINA